MKSREARQRSGHNDVSAAAPLRPSRGLTPAKDVPRAALWARVSTAGQETANQVAELREWAAARNVEIVTEFVMDASAWTARNGSSAVFDRNRAALLDGARLGAFGIVLTWGLDRLSRRGAEDMLKFTRQLTDSGAVIWARQDPWVESLSDPMVREILLAVFATLARFESQRRSERVKAGIARRMREDPGFRPGRQPGARDKKVRNRSGYVARWERERGGSG